jgi:hypothetical protein
MDSNEPELRQPSKGPTAGDAEDAEVLTWGLCQVDRVKKVDEVD